MKVTEHVRQEYPGDGKKVFRREYAEILMVPSSQEISVPTGTDRLKVTEHVSQEYPGDGIKVFGIEYVDIVMAPSSQEISVPLDR